MIQSTIKRYLDRYHDLKNNLALNSANTEQLNNLIDKQKSDLNNYFMAALGLSTLLLRLGAVVSLCKKLHQLDDKGDALFMKQVIDNLRESLPSDTSWRTIWEISATEDSHWNKPLVKDNAGQNILGRFVTFRNNFVHQSVRIIPEHSSSIAKSIILFDEMAKLADLFENTTISLEEDKFFFNTITEKYCLHPFLQKGEEEGLPYLFQGLYGNKTEAKFINTHFGNEWPDTKENDGLEKSRQIATITLEPTFEPMRQALKGGAGQVFDHSERLQYYLDCFVGREREVNSVIDWVKGDSSNRVLPIFSEAGMGKGALSAGIIDNLLTEKIPVMYHYCGSGIANSLHAVLYHFILQGKKMPGMNGAGVWNVEDESIQRKLERLPSRYYEAIKLFQTLIENCYSPTKKYEGKPLIIVIDGLDEAGVANSQLKISDWFYTYNEKDEPLEDWKSPEYVKWIFTYRSLPNNSKDGFRLDSRLVMESNELLQPLQGLTEDAVREALKPFEVSEEFIQTVMERGAVI